MDRDIEEGSQTALEGAGRHVTRRRFLSLIAAVPVVGPVLLGVVKRRKQEYVYLAEVDTSVSDCSVGAERTTPTATEIEFNDLVDKWREYARVQRSMPYPRAKDYIYAKLVIG